VQATFQQAAVYCLDRVKEIVGRNKFDHYLETFHPIIKKVNDLNNLFPLYIKYSIRMNNFFLKYLLYTIRIDNDMYILLKPI